MKKELSKAILKLGKWEQEVELRTNPKKLVEDLKIDLDTAVKLSAMEVLTDNRFGQNKSTFKNWNNKRIYFSNSVDSKNSNSKQRYWDLETDTLMDFGLSSMELREMTETLNNITIDTFYK